MKYIEQNWANVMKEREAYLNLQIITYVIQDMHADS